MPGKLEEGIHKATSRDEFNKLMDDASYGYEDACKGNTDTQAWTLIIDQLKHYNLSIWKPIVFYMTDAIPVSGEMHNSGPNSIMMQSVWYCKYSKLREYVNTAVNLGVDVNSIIALNPIGFDDANTLNYSALYESGYASYLSDWTFGVGASFCILNKELKGINEDEEDELNDFMRKSFTIRKKI